MTRRRKPSRISSNTLIAVLGIIASFGAIVLVVLLVRLRQPESTISTDQIPTVMQLPTLPPTIVAAQVAPTIETPFATEAPIPTMILTAPPIAGLTAVPGVVRIDSAASTFIIAVVSLGYNNTDTANALRLATNTGGNLRVRLDDGVNVTIYQYRDGQWQQSVTTLSLATQTQTPIPPATVYAITRTDGRACAQLSCEVRTYIPVGVELTVAGVQQGDAVNGNTVWYIVIYTAREIYVNSSQVSTIRPQPTAAPTSRRSSSLLCPSNCDQARARGMSASAAAACGLDRDHDGVACYGD